MTPELNFVAAMRCFAAVTAGLMSFATSHTAIAQGKDGHGSTTYLDWTVSCDADLYCIGKTEGRADTGELMTFKLERSNKAGGRLYVTTGPDGIPLAVGMRVDIDVLDMDYGVYGDVKKVYAGNEMTFAGSADRELVQMLRKGTRGLVTFEFGGSWGAIAYGVSLNGVTSVLAHMDQAQGRVERDDAAVLNGGLLSGAQTAARKTDDAASASSASPANNTAASAASQVQPEPEPDEESGLGMVDIVNFNQVPAPVQRYAYRVFGCDGEVMENGLHHHQMIEPALSLYFIKCFFTGEGTDYTVFIYDEADTSDAKYYSFEQPPHVEGDNAITLQNPFWNQPDYTLSGTFYYNPADKNCGVHDRYGYLPADDYFELLERREKPGCNGPATSPQSWPVTWTLDEMGN